MSTNNKISNLISSQVPFFVRNDHPKFVAFLEAYYEYLEQEGISLEEGKAVERIKNLQDYFDIDKTIDDFTDHFYNHFLQYIPANVLTDRRNLLKHIKDFYAARGTEKAAKFLIQILFDEDVDFYYPKADILKTSDGKWYVEKFLTVVDTSIDNISNNDIVNTNRFIHTKVFGQSSNSTAVVDDVQRSIRNGLEIDRLTLSDVTGRFKDGETIIARSTVNNNTVFVSANILNNGISSIVITYGGANYNVGDPVRVDSNTGTGANIIISGISDGDVIDIPLIYGGAGFQLGNPLTFTSNVGNNATGYVSSVADNNYYHPNTYSLIYSAISLEANTQISNSIYSNLNTSIISSPNADTRIVDAMQTFTLIGLGPIESLALSNGGSRYISSPTVDAISNTTLRSYGSLGRMQVLTGGKNYAVGDTITFTNAPGDSGFGARANVINVTSTGAIRKVGFVKWNDEPLGGSGYKKLPTAVISSINGSGAQVAVTSTMGDGEIINSLVSVYGSVRDIEIIDPGQGYTYPATANFMGYGDNTAYGYAEISTGYNELNGRFLNDDGFPSSYNFLQNKDYYQNFSYVMILRKSLTEYRDVVKNLIHPVGTKMFGEYDYIALDTDQLPEANISVYNMSINQSYFNIVTDGLIFHADIANTSSYPGIGSILYDISGNNNNANLVNSPIYVSGESILLNGIDQTIEALDVSAYSDLTIEMWIQDQNPYDLYPQHDLLTYNGIYGSYTLTDGTFRTDGNNLGGRNINGVIPPPQNSWYRFCYTKNNDVWINDVKYSGGYGGDISYGSLVIGAARDISIVPFKGKIGIIRVYNKLLTDDQVQRNYLVSKDRYGL